jgi:alpha-ketoglutarate-dependent taurine dioxygenase
VEGAAGSRTIGAEVRGVDIRHADERALVAVRDAVLRYSVVVLRGQRLRPEDQIGFLDRMHPLRPRVINDFTLPGHPAITVISNIVEDGRPIGINDAGILWHTDTCFLPDPDLFASLYAVEVPPTGGDTHFVSTAAAYDDLTDAERARFEGWRVVQSYAWSIETMRDRGLLRRAHSVEHARATMPDVEQPLIKTHPVTGRRVVYANEAFSRSIVGLEPAESAAVLASLFDAVTSPPYGYTHRWRSGDLLIWDNIATQHLATFDYGEQRRLLHRVSTAGPRAR